MRGGREAGSADAAAACSTNLESDPAHCGRCGHACDYQNGLGVCERGVCALAGCLPGFRDLNARADDGCEYPCHLSNNGIEVCDGLDNDCNGGVDDGFDTDTDVAHCGACGNRCALAQATVACRAKRCVIAACQPGYRDANGVAADGCECQLTGGGAEICDGKDNDCNGKVDDLPAAMFASDPQHCGSCATNCTTLPHAAGGCAAGTCTIAGCELGWVDRDRMVENGCEYACTPAGPEVCDGRDNDCDGMTDAADADLKAPEGLCSRTGECAMGTDGQPARPQCAAPPGGGPVQWVCNYRPTVQTTAPNQIVGQETLCDGLDNDCDGTADESFPQKGQPCDDGGGAGACGRRGTYMCSPDKTAAVCTFTTQASAPAHEICDGVDNDCDGLTDESWDDPSGTRCGGQACRGVRDDVARVMRAVSGVTYDVHVYAYEASRPDATATAAGVSGARACSRPKVMPWAHVTFAEAQAACQAAGMRLCKVVRDGSGAVQSDEWGAACGGASGTPYPYGATYGAMTCNGRDQADPDATLATGSLAACTTPDGVFDLSGNLAEWTDDPRGMTADGRTAYTLRGGSHATIAQGLQCGFFYSTVPAAFAFPDTGFRCCSTCPPGQAECAGSCHNLGTSTSHCGACGRPCGSGQSCQNGLCR
jgi:hypothetical protein